MVHFMSTIDSSLILGVQLAGVSSDARHRPSWPLDQALHTNGCPMVANAVLQ